MEISKFFAKLAKKYRKKIYIIRESFVKVLW